MSTGRAIVVTLEVGGHAAAALAAAAELARLTGLPLRGLVIQDPAMEQAGRLALTLAGPAPRPGEAMLARAIAREAQALAAEFEAMARAAGIACAVESRRQDPGEVLRTLAGSAEAVVIPVEPGSEALARRIAMAASLCRDCPAVLLVPGPARRARGPVLLLGVEGPPPDIARRLAEALDLPLIRAGAIDEAALPWGPGGVRLPRLVVAPASLERAHLHLVLRRWRAPLLILPGAG